jgi:phage tail-like protein
MTKNDPSANQNASPVTVSHIADFSNRYPGETVTLYTRLEVHEAVSDLTLRISLPGGLILGEYQPPPEQKNGKVPRVEVSDEEHYLVWSLEEGLWAETSYEYQTKAIVAAAPQNLSLTSQAMVMSTDDTILAAETVTLALQTKGKYLQYLPAVFEKDDLMGRLVMLFESFWAPIENQVDNIHYYFDPRTTPVSFLPWLASWLDLELDERWSEERVRQLIRWAIALHRSRGTKWGLLKYLEIYTGQTAKIVERIANNFVLGPEAVLGPAIALGQGNMPHTFTVNLRLPRPDIEDKKERAREEKLQRRTIESIIERQKPAHTLYTLVLEFVSPEELERQDIETETGAEAVEAEIDEIAAQAATWFKLEDE